MLDRPHEIRRPRGRRRIGLAHALLLSLYGGLALGYIGLWLLAFVGQETWRADFTNYYTGALLIREGYGPALYDLPLQARRQQEILGGRYLADGLLPFNHPPHLALLLVPLSVLPLNQAYAIWTLFNISLWIWFLIDVKQFASRWGAATSWLVVGVIATIPAMFHALILGASVILSTVALWGFYRALKAGREGIAGLWLLLGSVHPQVVVFPALLLLGARRWRALGTVIAGGLVVVVFCGLLLHWSVWIGFIEMLRWTAVSFDRGAIVPLGMVNWKGLLTLALGDRWMNRINCLTAIGLILAMGLALLMWRRGWKPDTPYWDLRFGLTLLMGLFFSPHANAQDSVIIAVPAILLWAFLKRQGFSARMLEGIPSMFYPIWLLDIFFWRPNLIPMIGEIALGIWILWLLRQEQAA